MRAACLDCADSVQSRKHRYISAVIFSGKSGLSAIRAKIVIDSTGDGDVAAKAGCDYEFGNEDGFCQPMTLFHKILFGSMGFLFVLAAAIIPGWFSLVPLDYGTVLVTLSLAALAFPLNRLIGNIFEGFGDWKNRMKEKIRRDIDKIGE